MTRWRQGLISKTAVAKYLNRVLEDSDELKHAPSKGLLEGLRELGYKYLREPRPSQIACITAGLVYPGYLFFVDMGGGKSKSILDLIRVEKAQKALPKSVLILVPEQLHIVSWVEQIRVDAPDLDYAVLDGARERRLSLLARKCSVYVMLYKGLEVLMSRLDSDRHKRVVEWDAAKSFASKFSMVVYDEGHRVGNYRSLGYSLCSILSSTIDRRYALTGTPFGRDPTPLWALFKLVDRGLTFGPYLGLFRAAFFTARDHYWKGIEYVYNDKMEPQLRRLMRNRSLRYNEAELDLELPPLQVIPIHLDLSQEGLTYYNRIVQRLREVRGDYKSLDAVFLRMRQCASGFLSLAADDDSRIEVRFGENPKIEAVRQLLLDSPINSKWLVFYEYNASGLFLSQLLDEMKISYGRIWGGAKDVPGTFEYFLSNRFCRVLLLNNRLGTEGINPQHACSRAIVYECPIESIRRQQLIKRLVRPGQKHPVFIYDLLMRGTVEEKILQYVTEGRDLLKSILDGSEALGEVADGSV